MGSPFRFRKHGQCGTELSELLPHTGKIVDDICVIRSMHTDINGHEPSIWFMNTGKPQPGRPAFGSWLTYGLGSESQNLPAYIAMPDPGGHPVDGVRNWSNGWMPPLFQATVIRAQEPRILNLDPPPHLKGDLQRENLDFLARLNRRHLERHPGEADLEARIASYELAARMQSAAKEALDISQETQATQNMYGLDRPETREYGTRLLIARRLVERGVRFVQIFIAGQIWDLHANLRGGLRRLLPKDRPAGRRPRHRLETARPVGHDARPLGRRDRPPSRHPDGRRPAAAGRDHNGQGFSIWLAGGGIKGGMTYGQTDDFGHHAAVNPRQPQRLPGDPPASLRPRPRAAHLLLQRPAPHADGRQQVPRGERDFEAGLTVQLDGPRGPSRIAQLSNGRSYGPFFTALPERA